MLRYGNVLLHRLYLPGGRAFFQLHLGADGRPDECRYFSGLDEVTPADPQEWGFLARSERGDDRLAEFPDQGRQALRQGLGARARAASRRARSKKPGNTSTASSAADLQAMLYGAPTGGSAAAPQTEYILVSAIEVDGQAWVEVDAGIDINPAALQLPGVPARPALRAARSMEIRKRAQAPATVFGALSYGLPSLLLHFGLVLALLIVGIFVYMAVTPFHERELLRAGNTAAATVLGGALVALAIPLAALLATTGPLARHPGLGRCRGRSCSWSRSASCRC